MPAYIKHHTVPACYLANFGINGNEDRESTVYYCEVKEKRYGIEKVDNIPVEKHFYDVDELGNNKTFLEKGFSNIEGSLSTLLKKIINSAIVNPEQRKSDFLQLSESERQELSAQLSMQIIRTWEFRNQLIDLRKQMKTAFPMAYPYTDTKADYRRNHINMILNSRISHFYANLFDDRNILVYINHTEVPFITSDNPVVKIDNRKEKNYPISDASQEITYYYPISPTIAIELFSKEILKCDLGCLDLYDKKLIASYNGRIMRQCTRFLFANKDLNPTKIR